MINTSKTLVEVDEILNYLSKEDLLKIPEEVRNTIKENKDKEYVWEYDESKELKDQDVSRDTIAFLSYLNMEYLLNEKQKEYMKQLHEINEKKMEEAKAEKFKVDDLFKRNELKNEQPVKNEEKIEETALVKYKESIFTKLVNKIKRIFYRN